MSKLQQNIKNQYIQTQKRKHIVDMINHQKDTQKDKLRALINQDARPVPGHYALGAPNSKHMIKIKVPKPYNMMDKMKTRVSGGEMTPLKSEKQY